MKKIRIITGLVIGALAIVEVALMASEWSGTCFTHREVIVGVIVHTVFAVIIWKLIDSLIVNFSNK